MAAVAMLTGAVLIVASQWSGTLRRNGRKTAGNLEHTIRTELGITGIIVEPNRPKAGDVTVSGTVNSQQDADTVTALIEEWRRGAWPSEIHVAVKTGTHNE